MPVLAELFGHYHVSAESKSQEISFAGQKIALERSALSALYRRYAGNEEKMQTTIMSDQDTIVIGIFPVAPIYTPKPISTNLYLKFKLPIVVDQRSQVVMYARMPIEVGIFRQLEDEELMIDSFSLTQQQFALYGPPENGIVCRYYETDSGSSKERVEPKRYQEALVRIRISNEIDNIVRVSKVVIPLQGVILDHAHDDVWLPGSVEMNIDSAFGEDVVNVRYVNAKVKRPDKTSKVKKEETRSFFMDAGY